MLPFERRRGLKVRALVHRTPIDHGDVEIVKGDLLDFRPEWLEGINAVIHLASLTDPGRSKDSMRTVRGDEATGEGSRRAGPSH